MDELKTPAPMSEPEKLELLKLQLQRTGTKLDSLLRADLKQAAAHIRQYGITPGLDEGDDYLQIDYAAYLYNRRNSPELEMPKSLAWDLRNRFLRNTQLLREKGQVDG